MRDASGEEGGGADRVAESSSTHTHSLNRTFTGGAAAPFSQTSIDTQTLSDELAVGNVVCGH